MLTVLRYTKEELLALHFTTTSPPAFPADTPVASEHSLPPVGTLPFDYDEIYKQWSLNRNRGRGRGRGAATATGGNQQSRGPHDRSRSEGKWGDDPEWDRHGKVRLNERALMLLKRLPGLTCCVRRDAERRWTSARG